MGARPFLADDLRALAWSVAFFFYGLGLDLVSTAVGVRYFPVHEVNALLVDHGGHYIPLKFLLLNSAPFLLFLCPLVVALGLAFRRYAVASLPFWALGAGFAWAGAGNVLLILSTLF